MGKGVACYGDRLALLIHAEIQIFVSSSFRLSRSVAVGAVRAVSVIHYILVREHTKQFFDHRKSTDARINDANWTFGICNDNHPAATG